MSADYQIIEELTSRRADETTYLAVTSTERKLYVKDLHLEHVESWKAVELFERELETLQQLSHPAIPIYLAGTTESRDQRTTLRYAREWVEGEPLSAVLERGETLDEVEVRRLLEAGADMLGYIHGFRPPIVHRNLTPEHVIGAPSGELHFVGFGSVQAALPRTSGGSTFVGTSGYIAPEQLMGKATPASDIYALAATAVALLSGFRPSELPSDGMRLLFEDHVDASDALVGLLGQMLDPVAERRPAAGDRLRARLDHLDRAASPGELMLLDHPPPSTLRVRADERSLEIRVRRPLRSALRFIVFPIALLLAELLQTGIILAEAGFDPALLGLLLVRDVLSVMTVTTFLVLPLLVVYMWPRKFRLDEWGIRRGLLGSFAYSDIDDVYVQPSASLVMLTVDGEEQAVSGFPLETDEAEWIAAMIARRIDDG